MEEIAGAILREGEEFSEPIRCSHPIASLVEDTAFSEDLMEAASCISLERGHHVGCKFRELRHIAQPVALG